MPQEAYPSPVSESRRRFIVTAGSAGIVGLAGCSGDGGTDTDGNTDASGDSDTDGNTASGGDPVDSSFTSYTRVRPQDAQYNPHRLQNEGPGVEYLFDQLAKYDEDGGFIPLIAQEWNIPSEVAAGDVIEIQLNEDYTWHDGSSVTAQDIVTQLRIEKLFDDPVWNSIESVSAADETTVEMTVASEINPELLKHNLFAERRVNQPHSVFGEYAGRIEDATTDDERAAVEEDLVNFTLEEPVGNGPFQFSDRGETELVLERYSDYSNGHITADDINYPNVEFIFRDGDTLPLFLSGDVDGGDIILPPEQKNALQDYARLQVLPLNNGEGMCFNFENQWLSNVRVRQALAHVVNRQDVLQAMPNIAEQSTPLEVPCSLSTNAIERHLGDLAGDFTQYAYQEVNEDRATELLEAEGFSKENGLWNTPDGELFELEVASSSSGTWLSHGQSVVGALQKFGIRAQLQQHGETTFWGDVIPNNDYDMVTHAWGGGGAHPYFTLRNDLVAQARLDVTNQPVEWEVPMPIGNPDGELETINVEDKIVQLERATDQEEATELIRELAWVSNQMMPRIPQRQYSQVHYYRVDNWEFPEPDAPSMQPPAASYWPLRVGEMRAKTE